MYMRQQVPHANSWYLFSSLRCILRSHSLNVIDQSHLTLMSSSDLIHYNDSVRSQMWWLEPHWLKVQPIACSSAGGHVRLFMCGDTVLNDAIGRTGVRQVRTMIVTLYTAPPLLQGCICIFCRICKAQHMTCRPQNIILSVKRFTNRLEHNVVWFAFCYANGRAITHAPDICQQVLNKLNFHTLSSKQPENAR